MTFDTAAVPRPPTLSRMCPSSESSSIFRATDTSPATFCLPASALLSSTSHELSSLQETDWPPPATKLAPTPSAVLVMLTVANALSTATLTVSPGAAMTALSGSSAAKSMVAASAVCVVETDTSTASATAKAAAAARPYAPNVVTYFKCSRLS